MNILRFGARKPVKAVYSTPDDNRPVKLIQVSKNVWHVIYAD